MLPVSPFPNRKDVATEALRVPPHSLEAEQAVLGGLMLDNATWDQVVDRLDEYDFYRADHRLIFRAIRRLAEQGKPFDLLTLAEWLEDHNELEEGGGFAWVHWAGTRAQEEEMAARFETSIRCLPFPDQVPEAFRGEGRCILTGEPSAQRVVMAKAY